MKYGKLSLVALLVLTGSTLQAGTGKTFGASLGGSFIGSSLSNVMTRPRSETVIVRDSGGSRSERRLRRENRELEQELHDVKLELRECRRDSGRGWFR